MAAPILMHLRDSLAAMLAWLGTAACTPRRETLPPAPPAEVVPSSATREPTPAPSPPESHAVRALAGPGQRLLRLERAHTLAHDTFVSAIAWSADGTLLAVGDDKGRVRLWTPDGAAGPVLAVSDRSVRRLALFPDRRTLVAVCGADLHVWDTERRQARHVLRGHEDLVVAIQPVSPTRLMAVDLRNTLRVWDLEKGSVVSMVKVPTIHALSCSFSADTTTLAVGGYGSVALLDVATGGERKAMNMPSCRTAPQDPLCFPWRRARVEESGIDDGPPSVHEQDVADFFVHASAFVPDGSALLIARADGALIIADPHAATGVKKLETSASPLYCVAVSPDGRTFAAGGKAGVLWLGDARDREWSCHEQAHPNHLVAAAFSPDGTRLATAGNTQAAIWGLS